MSGAFALPRCVYAMADDGLLFAFFASINRVTKVLVVLVALWSGRISLQIQVPLNAIIVFTLMNAVLALIFDLEALVEFLSIGTLLAYSVVSACVLILRHKAAPLDGDPTRFDNGESVTSERSEKFRELQRGKLLQSDRRPYTIIGKELVDSDKSIYALDSANDPHLADPVLTIEFNKNLGLIEMV